MINLPANPGSRYRCARTATGKSFEVAGKGDSIRRIQVRNDLGRGSIDIELLCGTGVAARKTSLIPGQEAVFEMEPTIFVALADGAAIEQGKAFCEQRLPSPPTRLGLFGIATADLIAVGGAATALRFALEAVRHY